MRPYYVAEWDERANGTCIIWFEISSVYIIKVIKKDQKKNITKLCEAIGWCLFARCFFIGTSFSMTVSMDRLHTTCWCCCVKTISFIHRYARPFFSSSFQCVRFAEEKKKPNERTLLLLFFINLFLLLGRHAIHFFSVVSLSLSLCRMHALCSAKYIGRVCILPANLLLQFKAKQQQSTQSVCPAEKRQRHRIASNERKDEKRIKWCTIDTPCRIAMAMACAMESKAGVNKYWHVQFKTTIRAVTSHFCQSNRIHFLGWFLVRALCIPETGCGVLIV